MPAMELNNTENESERFSELMGEKETRGALTFLLELDKKDLLVYTQIIKEMHRLMKIMVMTVCTGVGDIWWLKWWW